MKSCILFLFFITICFEVSAKHPTKITELYYAVDDSGMVLKDSIIGARELVYNKKGTLLSENILVAAGENQKGYAYFEQIQEPESSSLDSLARAAKYNEYGDVTQENVGDTMRTYEYVYLTNYSYSTYEMYYTTGLFRKKKVFRKEEPLNGKKEKVTVSVSPWVALTIRENGKVVGFVERKYKG